MGKNEKGFNNFYCPKCDDYYHEGDIPVSSRNCPMCGATMSHIDDKPHASTPNSIDEIREAVKKAMSAEFELEARTRGEDNPFADGARGMRDTVLNIITAAELGKIPRRESE